MKEVIFIRFGEIFLKGKNRPFFIQKLKGNIITATKGKITERHSYFLLEGGKVENLTYVPGIRWWGRSYVVKKDLEEIKKVCERILSLEKPKTFRLQVKRADKKFPFNSMEIARLIGEHLVLKLNLSVNLSSPEKTLYIYIGKKESVIVFDRIEGLGGLPVSASGNGLLLFSGGIDSPVAGFLMQKRGMSLDLIHFHVFKNASYLKETKILELAKILARYQRSIRLFAVPYYPFQMRVLELEKSGLELILFRRFMLKLSEKIAFKQGYKILITGDSLGQVASQTLHNLFVANFGLQALVLRPLIGLDKENIINLARRINTFEPSLKSYKDCCSIVSRKPKIQVDVQEVLEQEKKLNLNSLIEETRQKIEILEIKSDI